MCLACFAMCVLYHDYRIKSILKSHIFHAKLAKFYQLCLCNIANSGGLYMIICKLRVKRAEKNISQHELNEATGVRLQTISDMEQGKSKSYSSDNLSKLCDYFHCNVSDIIEYVPDNTNKE